MIYIIVTDHRPVPQGQSGTAYKSEADKTVVECQTNNRSFDFGPTSCGFDPHLNHESFSGYFIEVQGLLKMRLF